MKKKKENISRDDFWMGMAFNMAAGSRNATERGAVVINSQGELLAISHGAGDEQVIHPEMHAVVNSKISFQNGILYSTHPPCHHCALAVAASGIKRVIFYPFYAIDPHSADVFKSFFVHHEEFRGNLHWMRDYLKSLSIFSRQQ